MNAIKKRWVNVAVFESVGDAQKLEKILQQRRFEARTYNDRLLQLFLFLCPPQATYRAQVRLDDLHPAQDFLDSDPAAQLIVQRALHCPSCESLRVQYPQMTRRFLTPTILLNLGIIFRLIEHEAYCEHCQFVWHLPKARQGGKIETVPKADAP